MHDNKFENTIDSETKTLIFANIGLNTMEKKVFNIRHVSQYIVYISQLCQKFIWRVFVDF